MDSPWTYALISVALVALVASWRVPRAWWWIGLGGLSFLVTTLFYDYAGRPDLHPILTISCDALVCLAIFWFYREDWELGVFIAFLASVFSSVLMIGGFIPAQWVYASLLELCNLGALLCIIGTGLVDRIGRHEHSRLHPIYLDIHRSRHPL
jgi:CDP-diglyceride synthetase